MSGTDADDAMGDLKDLFGGIGDLGDDIRNADYANHNVESMVFDASILSPGVVVTFYPFNWLFFDLQYNLAPTFQASCMDFVSHSNYDTYYETEAFGIGLGHIFGASLRFKKFVLGAEYKVAKIKNFDYWMGDMSLDGYEKYYSKEKYNGNHLRLFVGVKF